MLYVFGTEGTEGGDELFGWNSLFGDVDCEAGVACCGEETSCSPARTHGEDEDFLELLGYC